MSDFLSNLAARSLDQADAIRPRPLPLFAPAPRAGWASLEQVDDLELVDRTPRGAPSEPAQPPIAPPMERRAQVDPAALGLPPAPPATRSLPDQHSEPQTPLALRPVAAAPRPWPGAESLHRPPPEAPAMHVAATRALAPVPVAERMVVERVVTPAPAVERVVAERVAAPEPAPHSPTRTEAPPIEQVVIERIVTPAPSAPSSVASPAVFAPTEPRPIVSQPIVVQPRIAPVQRAEPAQPAPAAPEPAPTIQVTIGRIEVRSTPAPAQPTRGARPAQPALSLDDYLRSRNGGGR